MELKSDVNEHIVPVKRATSKNMDSETPFEILGDLLPIDHNTILEESGNHTYWIRWRLTPIASLAISMFKGDQPKLNNTDIDDKLLILEILEDYTWENLNTGHWKDVPMKWLRLKSTLSLLEVAIKVGSDPDVSPQEIIKICDKGLLLGYPPFLNNILSTLASRFHSLIHIPVPHGLRSQTSANSSQIKLKSPTLVKLEGQHFSTPTLTKPSLETFISEHFKLERPCILSGIIESWPAMKTWTPEYILQVGGGRTVPVEIGSKYTSEEWTQKLLTIQEFVTSQFGSDDSSKGESLGYLAQYQLFDQLPELRKDINVPDYCFVGKATGEEDVEINAWFGPALTLTPTHYDPKHNLLSQVFGTKFIRLFPPQESVYLYPNDPDSLLFNTSQVDLEDPLVMERFPSIRNAQFSDIQLNPGQVLYIPPKWWHAVQSLSPSFSVSFWFE